MSRSTVFQNQSHWDGRAQRWGLYVHIPFCPYHCIYCDFDAGVYSRHLIPHYVAALRREMAFVGQNAPQDVIADTVYFGGGTPSLFPVDRLAEILRSLDEHFIILEGAEITLEANPESITRQRAEALRRLGINRVSVGVQSFIDEELRMLGRGHTVEDVQAAFAALRQAGFQNINLDLIGGLPGQSMERWLSTLDAAFALRPEHLSMYLLEVHEGTPLARLLAQGRLPRPDDELSVEMYYALCDRARAEGYEHYELSNYCLPGFHSRHNLKYWSDEPYWGFGSSAASYDGRERRVNVRTPRAYIDRVRQCGHATAERIPMTPERRRQEALFLGLRRIRGIDLGEFRARYGVDPWSAYEAELQPLVDAGLVVKEGGHLKLTRKGWVLSNEVFAVFV
ncbi:MAG: radical SAM family heme chaperone HemW [Acidobacteria bacterium]|nr:MAG: radical SAM family heme chaperone HemW [Acidobacteriota bacterium]